MSKKIYNRPEVKEIRSSSLAWEECGGSGDAWDCNGIGFCCVSEENYYIGSSDHPNAYHCCS